MRNEKFPGFAYEGTQAWVDDEDQPVSFKAFEKSLPLWPEFLKPNNTSNL
ncbi:MAG: hypothetical protein V2I46_03565 [Bacteroides sp.]|jgi:hypothetical protein|nr:hypothetical protein [Bacteroides sp.]